MTNRSLLLMLLAAGQFLCLAAVVVLLGVFGGLPEAWLGRALAASAGLAVVLAATAMGILWLHERLGAARRRRSLDARGRLVLQSRSAVILGLAKLAESRDDETGEHLDRIRRYVRVLGEQLLKTHPEVDREFVETIVETSALHDIGKVGIPDRVLLKEGTLTDEQRVIINKHPLIGGDTLLAVKRRWGDDQFLVTACEIVFAHHERWDGTGYPFGLEGDMIPLSARIVALADVYDALTSPRVYKPEMAHAEARAIIEQGRGTQFDPDVVDAFIVTADEFRRVSVDIEEPTGFW